MKRRVIVCFCFSALLMLQPWTTARALDSLNVTQLGRFSYEGGALDVAVGGHYAYVAQFYDAGVYIVDIQNPAAPTLVFDYPTAGFPDGVDVAGRYLYIALEGVGLEVVNVSNPAAPVQMGICDTPGSSFRVAVSGSYAYVADGMGGLTIVTAYDPPLPITVVGNLNLGVSVRDVAVQGGYAYIATNYGNLEVVDISDPTSPWVAGNYLVLWEMANAVTVSGHYAYVTYSTDGLRIFNVSNPYSPALVGNYTTPGQPNDVKVAGHNVVVTDYSFGLSVVNVCNPAAPVRNGYYNTPGHGNGVAAVGAIAYVADESALRIFDCSVAMGAGVPLAPDSLVVQYLTDEQTDLQKFQLNWAKVPFDTSGLRIKPTRYVVYRDTLVNGTYDSLGVPSPEDGLEFYDSTSSGRAGFYQVRAVKE